MRKRIILSDRLKAVADMVTHKNRVCDVGCDHAFIPIYLVSKGISPYVLAMDLRKGPLGQADENIREYGFEKYIETRLSNGLDAYREGEADSLVCAGMGGRLIMNILEREPAKTASFKELILQPQSELEQFRHFLGSSGYMIADENMIEEGGKFYPMIRAVKIGKDAGTDLTESLTLGKSFEAVKKEKDEDENEDEAYRRRLEDRYGPVLIRSKNPVLCRYLEWEMGIYRGILSQLEIKLRTEEIPDLKLSARYAEVELKLREGMAVLKEIGGYSDGKD